MKRLFLLLALCSMVAVGCTEGGVDDNIDNGGNNTEQPGEENEIPDDAYISINKDILTFSPNGESVEVKVYCNYEWTLTNNCDWVTASISGGEASEDGTTITLTANLTYDNREGTIIFSCGKAKKVLMASQGLKEVIIADENNTFNLPAEGGTVDIAYQTTVECKVVIPSDAQHWISLAPETRGLESGCATLNIAKSNVGVDRRAVVKVVKMGDQSVFAKYTITQERNMDYIILYTTTNGETIKTSYSGYLSNTYEDGVGMLAFDGSEVSSIGRIFRNCDSLTSVTIPDSVTSIGEGAFYYCTSLTSVTIGNGVTSIGDFAFEGCTSLTSVYITDIAAWCNISFGFIYSNPLWYAGNLYLNNELVTDLIIPDSVTSIGNSAFSDCTSLTSVTIPDSVTSIGSNAFYSCDSLTSVYITDIAAWCNISFDFINSNPLYYAENLYLNNELVTDLIIPDGATKIGSYAFYGYDLLTSVTIGNGVTSIGNSAFSDCTSLASVTIPDSVTSIGDHAFYSCTSLTSVTIPDSVTSIGSYAFYSCTGELIVNCNIPSASTSEYGAFYGSRFTRVTIGDSVTSIGDRAFYDCNSLTSITIGKGVTSIGDEAFYNCTGELIVNCNIPSASTSEYGAFYGSKFTRVTIGDSVTSIGDYAFYYRNSLTSVTIGNGVTSIGDYAFYYCDSLKSVTIPDSVTSIGDYAFYECDSLTSVTIGNSVTWIGERAFRSCTSLTSVTIGDSVTSVGDRAFEYCTSLTSVYITDIAAWCNISFGDYDSNPLYYANNLYLNNELVTDLIIPDSVTSIGDYAFRDCDSLTSITIPDSVTSIGDSAFYSCSSLTSVTIPDSVTSIENSAFSFCKSLTSVTIPDSVTSIGDDAFSFCNSLKEIYCKPTTPPTGGNDMFYSYPSGRKIYVPRNSVEAYKSANGWSEYASVIVGYDF